MRSTPAYPIRLLALALAYAVTARLGQAFAIPPGNVTAVWIPSGLAVGALVLWGQGMWPAVWIGSFAYNLWFYLHGPLLEQPMPMVLALGIATGRSLMAVAGSTLIRLVQGDGEDLARPRDVLAFVGLAGLLSTMLSASLGTVLLLRGDALTPEHAGQVWVTWWLGDAAGVILVAPVVVIFGRLGWPRFPGERASLAWASGGMLALLLALAFGPLLPPHTATILLALPVGFLSWTAFRLGRRATVLSALAIAVVAVRWTAIGRGPLVGGDMNESLLLLHSYLATAALTGLLLATTVRASRRPAPAGADLPQATGNFPVPLSEAERQLEQSLAQRRREESALADRVRALAEEARTLERQLDRRGQERDAVLAVLPDLFYVIDRATQRFSMVSEAFAREAAGLGRDEVMGRTVYDVLAPDLALRLAEQHREVFATGDPLHVRAELPLPGGAREMDTVVAPFRGPDGEVVGLLSSSRTLRAPGP